MRFTFTKNNEEWHVVPMSGVLEGRVVAHVDGACLRDVQFVAKTIEGSIKALWGVTIVDLDVYEDIETLKALNLGGRFDVDVEYPLVSDFDGFYDRSNRKCLGARRVLLMGPSVFASRFAHDRYNYRIFRSRA